MGDSDMDSSKTACNVKHLNYCNLHGVPDDVVEDKSIQCLYMKRNLLKTLVRVNPFSCVTLEP